MYLIALFSCLFLVKTTHSHPLEPPETTTTLTMIKESCPQLEMVEHGVIKIIDEQGLSALITCDDGYDLDGSPSIYCSNGEWHYSFSPPRCSKRCDAPPYVRNGALEIDRGKDENGKFDKGTLATYSCGDGYTLTPPASRFRVCENGIWTGAYATCVLSVPAVGCRRPKDIANGYFVHEKVGFFAGFEIGQRLHYSCNSGYALNGTPVQQCLEDGTWSPRIPPVCSLWMTENSNDFPCPLSPSIPHSWNSVLEGSESGNSALPGTIIEIHCLSKYRNIKAPCQPGKLKCLKGRWVGTEPICVPVHECNSPPPVSYAIMYNPVMMYETPLNNNYPFKSEVSYQCLPGYVLEGNKILACSMGGCWLPAEPPVCYRAQHYSLEVDSINAVLISAATGAGVLGLLLVICLITICRRRRPLSRAVTITAPVQRPDLGDHATLLHHPDRLALIAFADGMQNDQVALPTYDEATRDRGPGGLTANRLHRPHWPNLAGIRRTRNPPNLDAMHVTRHGSFASHTPSTRSAGDSMGSTDTMAVSEGSTNVTLDTASSHSGSQAASCRVHCGSLASFDTSSVINTEGVPLLEESELEEIQGGDDNISLVVGNPSISDNASFKLSIASADLAS